MEEWIRLLITPSFEVRKQCLTDVRDHWTSHHGPSWVSEMQEMMMKDSKGVKVFI